MLFRSTSVSINNQVTTYVAKSSELVKNKPITFVGEITNADAAIAVLDQSPGYRIPVTFTFAKAAPVTLDTLIVNGDGIYEVLNRYRPTSSAPVDQILEDQITN